MPSVPSRARAYNHASDLPPEFWESLQHDEPAAGIVLPFARKAMQFPRGDGNEQLWIIIRDESGSDIEFVLSCTKGELGNYPIFIFTAKSSAQLAREEKLGNNISDSLSQLILCLLSRVHPRRVFSVFSIATVAEKFAKIFEEHTHQEYNITACKHPYYDAIFTFCTKDTLNDASASFNSFSESDGIRIALCLADDSYLEGVKALCKGFSKTSPPYILDEERAELEARTLIDNRKVWVHMIKEGDKEWETACLVATTRESENVTAITKVFTVENWRGRGCAGRLLHRVCQEILQRKSRVVLYVGNGDSIDLKSARKVYHKIGFQGLDPSEDQCTSVEGVERWVEIGFDGTDLGYW